MDGDRDAHGPVATILVARRLDSAASGSAVLLGVCLDVIRRAGLCVRIVLAPRRAFGNRPWMRLHPVLKGHVDRIEWPGTLRHGDLFVSSSPLVWLRFALRLAQAPLVGTGLRLGALSRVDSALGETLGPAEARRLARAANRIPSRVIVAEYSSLGPVLALCVAARRGVLLHDLFSLRAGAFVARTARADHFAPTLAEEVARCADADFLLYASRHEAETISPLLPKARHIWLRPAITPAGAPPDGRDQPPRAVFIGTRHCGNYDALEVLLGNIWPAVRRHVPTAELWIAGPICETVAAEYGRPDGVRLLGVLDDLGFLGGRDAIGLAPTRVGSGVSIKVADYLALGMAVVALPDALTGYGAVLDGNVAMVPEPQAFAEVLVTLLTDRARRHNLAARGARGLAAISSNTQFCAYLRAIDQDRAGSARTDGPV